MSGASQPDAASSRPAPRTVGRLAWLKLDGEVMGALPAAAIAAVAGAAFLWRTLAWEPAVRVDGWAYAAWGQAIARGERPLFDLGATTPKPLAALLGLLIVPLPPERALAVVAALALAALVWSLFTIAYREGGGFAAVVSVVALVFGAAVNAVVAFGYIDAVVSALILLAIALRGRWRIAALVLAGLLRPEAWLLAAVAGFNGAARSWWRRAGGALACGLIAPVLWMLSDVALIRDPLGTLHWQSQRRLEVGSRQFPGSDVFGEFWAALTELTTSAVLLVGVLGLVLHYIRTLRRGSADPLPLAAVIVWLSLLALENYLGGGELPARYLLPIVSLLALGCGLLVATFAPGRLRWQSPWPGVIVTAGVLVVAAVSMDTTPRIQEQMARNAAIIATRPVVEEVLNCGRLGITRRIPAKDLIPQLAASSRSSMYKFGIYKDRRRFAAVLHRTRRSRPVDADAALPPWPRVETPLGPLAVAPGCGAGRLTR